jgi:hypothetical protein
MKNQMKKIIASIFSFALIFIGQTAFSANSSVSWNTLSNDCSTVAIANDTQQVGFGGNGSPCWTGRNITANAGDSIKVRVYYHNTGTTVANNTKLRIIKSGNSNTFTFSGQIISDAGTFNSNNPASVSLNIPANQTLSYVRTEWYPNQTNSIQYPNGVALLNGQNGSEILDSSLEIGNITASGWSTQGTAMAIFKVSSTTPPPPPPPASTCLLSDLSAEPATINYGGETTVFWNTVDCINVKLNNSPVTTYGSQAFGPLYVTKTFTLTGTGEDNAVKIRKIIVTVNTNTPQSMTGSLNANSPSCIIAKNSSTCSIVFNWSTQNPVSVSAVTHNGGTVAVGNNDTESFEIENGSQTYFLYNNGQKLDTEIVSASCASGSLWSGTYCAPIINNNTCTIDSFTVDGSSVSTTINKGDSALIKWQTTNCSYVKISTGPITSSNTYGATGSISVHPIVNTTYTLNANNINGIGVSAQVVVYVTNSNNNSCTIDYFSASDTSITRGNPTTLSWRTIGCANVTISNLNYNIPLTGSQVVYPTNTITYILDAQDLNGFGVSDQVTVNVNSNSGGGGGGGSVVCYIDDFTASDTWINPGDPVTLKWNTSYCNDVYISSIGSVSVDGSKIVYPVVPTTYTLTATRNSSVKTKSITINMDTTPVYNSNVVTTVATNISQTGAQLNGLITNSSYVNNSVYFNYGTTVNMGTRTSSRSTNSSTSFSEYVTSLSPKTIYFFQAVSDGPNGVSKGAIEVFQTLGYVNNNQVIKQIVYQQGNTVLPSASPIMLRIENKYQNIGVGDIIDYTVYYKNISSSTLTNPMVQVFIPKGITLLNTSRGTYSIDERTLSAPIEILRAGDEGVIYLQARVDSIDSTLAQIVTTAILVYTNPNGAQENAMAYVLNNPKNGNNLLGASAFFGGMFGMSLIGWLILIIIIMLLILLSRSYYGRKSVTTTVTHQ